MPDLKKFRENVKRYRKRGYTPEGKRYTQENLAEAIGLSAGELGHRLNGNGHVSLSRENVLAIVLTPRLLGSTTDQKLIDALIEFDHAHRTLYSAILGHKLVITQSAYSHIPDLIAAAGHLYREMWPHWERAEHDLAKDNDLADG